MFMPTNLEMLHSLHDRAFAARLRRSLDIGVEHAVQQGKAIGVPVYHRATDTCYVLDISELGVFCCTAHGLDVTAAVAYAVRVAL